MTFVYTVFYNEVVLSPKELTAFRMAPELMKAMRRVKATKGIPIATQLDFAVRKWLKSEGIKVETPSRRVNKTRRKG